MISIIINNCIVLIIILIGKWEIVHTTTITIMTKRKNIVGISFSNDFFFPQLIKIKNKNIWEPISQCYYKQQAYNKHSIIMCWWTQKLKLLCTDDANKIVRTNIYLFILYLLVSDIAIHKFVFISFYLLIFWIIFFCYLFIL